MRLTRELREAIESIIEDLRTQGYEAPQAILAEALTKNHVQDYIYEQVEWQNERDGCFESC